MKNYTILFLLILIISCKQPEWGLLQADDKVPATKLKLSKYEVDVVRVPVYFYTDYKSDVADDYLRSGYRVQLNFNWKPTGTQVGYPTDEQYIRRKAHQFFFHYLLYRDQIPAVVCENEWDNGKYHSGTIQEYLNELRIVVQVGHQYGFKIADAGITGNGLQRWMYSVLEGEDKEWWRDNYFIGLDNSYELMCDTINEYVRGIRDINIDYINLHWYNNDKCPGGYPMAVEKYMELTRKKVCINNEWGIRRSSNRLFRQTYREIRKSGAVLGVAYSGERNSEKAVYLTDEMLNQLP